MLLHVAVLFKLLFMRGQTMTKVKLAAAAAAHYQLLDAKYPNSVRAQTQSVSRRYSNLSPDFSLPRLAGASARDKSVERNNGSGDVGSLRRSERISSRAQSVEPSARGVQVKPRWRSAARSGAT